MRILVVSMSNLGDAILTYPALTDLWETFPGAECDVLAAPRTRALFEAEPRVARVWVRQKRSLVSRAGVLARLLRRRYTHVADFRNSLIPFLFPGARRTPIFHRSGGDPRHRVAVHRELVRHLGAVPSSRPCRLPFGPEEVRQVAGWLSGSGLNVVVVPGARSHLKRWRAAGFAAVADRLTEERGARVLLVGAPQERPIAEEVERNMRCPAVNLVGRTNLRQLAALLDRAALVLTNDNACLHAAAVTGVPTVAVFGPTDERKYGPRGVPHAVVRRALVCAPCERAQCFYHHECMEWTRPEEVYAACARLLEPGERIRNDGPRR